MYRSTITVMSLYANALPIIALMRVSLLTLYRSIVGPAKRPRPLLLRGVAGAVAVAIAITTGMTLATQSTLAIEAPDLDDGETLVIRADQAWETRDTLEDGSKGPRSLHFKGNFRLDAPDWFIRADSATLFGDVADPKSISVEGTQETPARVWMVDENGDLEVDAKANQVEYFRHNDRLKLTGNAVLEEQRNTLRSSSIDYDLKERRLVATGSGGVEIVTQPNGKPTPEPRRRVEATFEPQ